LVCVLGCFFGLSWFLAAVGCGVVGFGVTTMLILLVVGVKHFDVRWLCEVFCGGVSCYVGSAV
jgi:hypothetical protein